MQCINPSAKPAAISSDVKNDIHCPQPTLPWCPQKGWSITRKAQHSDTLWLAVKQDTRYLFDKSCTVRIEFLLYCNVLNNYFLTLTLLEFEVLPCIYYYYKQFYAKNIVLQNLLTWKYSNIIFLGIQEFIVYGCNVDCKSEICIVSDFVTETGYVLSIILWDRKTLIALSITFFLNYVFYNSKVFLLSFSHFKGLLKLKRVFI